MVFLRQCQKHKNQSAYCYGVEAGSLYSGMALDMKREQASSCQGTILTGITIGKGEA